MSDHTKGPWSYDQRLIYDNSPYGPIATVYRNQADAARIVACVNACEGMNDPAVYIERVRRDRQEFMAERDEALDALERAHETYYGNPDQAAFATIEATLLKHGRLK